MKFDLTFTQDERWIAARQKAWKEIEDDVAEDLTKKQVESIRRYFFTGVPRGWIKNYPDALLLYFPSCSEKAVRFVLKEYVSLEGSFSEDVQFWAIQINASLNLDLWPGVSRKEKLNIFKAFFGESYDPNRKFPFLIGDEGENRNYSYTAGGMFSIMLGRFVGWCRSDEEGIQVWPDLVDYMLSIIPHAESWIFKKNLSEEERDANVGGVSVDAFSRNLQELMQNIVTPPKALNDNLYASLRKEKLKQVGGYLDNLPGPIELIEHWHWVKAEYASE